MIKNRIQIGSRYQVDLQDLVVIGQNTHGICLHYKQGLQVQIDVTKEDEKERQYLEICANQLNYLKEPAKSAKKS